MIAERRRPVALVLFAVALGLLFAGRFVAFDSSSDASDWIFPLGLLALVAAVASLVVAWPQPRARLWLGIVLVVLMVLVFWQSAVNDGFRFIWSGDEGELWTFEVVVLLLSAVLVTTAAVALGGPRRLLRIPAYLIGVAVVSGTVAAIMVNHYESTCATDDDDGCLAALGGLVWGVGAVISSAVVILVIELILWRRRRTA